MAKKKEKKEKWPPNHPAGSGPEPEIAATPASSEPAGSSLVDKLSALPGLSRELAGRMVSEGNWPAEASELARRYGLAQMDAEAVLRVLNVNRGRNA